MCSYDTQVTRLTHKLSCTCERISQEDLVVVSDIWNMLEKAGWMTYEFNIASDMLTDSEETA